MGLAPGSRLGSYDIVTLLGVGGMGEVYRARDERLKRDVAVKVLPEAFARNEERVARFEREAQALASLKHPHIATIHELAQSDGMRFLVLELVEGETLASHLVHGPIAAPEALRIARQIIDALDAAHEKGIIHRDLKPANVMLGADGTVKVLDFGLAKLTSVAIEGPSGSALTNSPTVMASAAGMILGTAAYMSPEQAAGKPVDRRADIWAFGVVLYEMLTGRSPFQAETLQETIASVLKEEPDLSRVPDEIRPLLQQCLVKSPTRRLRDIGDASLLLDAAPRTKDTTPRAGWLWPAVAATLAIGVAVAIWEPWRRPPALDDVTRFQMAMPGTGIFSGSLDLSPSGRRLVFSAQGQDGRRRLWIRDLDSLTTRPIPGTELTSDFAGAVSWAPDSRFIAFSDGNTLKKVEVSGNSPPVTIAKLPVLLGESSWNEEGVILIGGITAGPIWRVPEAGGEATAVTALTGSESAHGFPQFLPDGRHFLYLRPPDGIHVGSLDVSPERQASERLLMAESQASYVPPVGSSPGRLLFARQSRLLTQPFDAARLALTGEAIMVAPSVGRVGSRAFFTVSKTGTLAYSGGSTYQLTWVDRTGRGSSGVVESVESTFARVSPNGTHVAFDHVDETGVDIWLVDVTRDVRTRLSFDRARDEFPIWSPDGSRVLFRSDRSGVFDLYEKAVDGSGEDRLVLHTDLEKWPNDWSHDGRYVIYEERSTQDDLWVLPMDGDRKPVALTRTEFSENHAQFSPDGRWISYQSMQSGQWEVYIRPFISPGRDATASSAVYQVSRDGGYRPVWRGDGRELVYIAGDGSVVAVDVTTNPQVHVSAARRLFQMPAVSVGFPRLEMQGDGQRFLVNARDDNSSSAITVVLNWQAGLRR